MVKIYIEHFNTDTGMMILEITFFIFKACHSVFISFSLYLC